METAGASLKAKFDSSVGGWLAFATIGALVLHAMGFLALRFHLATLGVRADLSLLDSRYVFEGANCLVYLLGAVVNLVLVLLGVGLVFFLLSRLVRRSIPGRLRTLLQAPWERLSPTMTGIVFAVAAIQLIMRQCFRVQDLLFHGAPSEPSWLRYLLLSQEDIPRAAYFMILLALVGVTAWLLLIACYSPRHGRPAQLGRVLLALLLGLETSLLPINYGILTAGGPLPRVIHLSDDQVLAGRLSWLVWKDQDGMTLLVVSPAAKGVPPPRTLVTIPTKQEGRVEVGQREPVLQLLEGTAK